MKTIRYAMCCCVALFLLVAGCTETEQGADFEKQVQEYIKNFPYQDTYNYAVKFTGSDPAKLNTWVFGAEPELVRAGQDKVVRMNNDTYYKVAFMLLDEGPVVLESAKPSNKRFYSFQLMDDHNVNFRNVIHPDGKYTIYHGKEPASVEGEVIESPSALAVVGVRVEVKDKNKGDDVAAAKEVFNGITISGPMIEDFPQIDLLSGFGSNIADEANKRIDEVFETTDFSKLIAGSGDVPNKVSYLQLAAGTKGGWGGPVTSHSAYETFFTDKDGKELDGSKGTYTLTTEEPPVDAFWSVTVYDTRRGGFLHPNDDDRYHINNTSAVANKDGTFTFNFKTKCDAADKNCLEVPAGPFDFAIRYYLPKEPIRSGEWRMPKPVLVKVK